MKLYGNKFGRNFVKVLHSYRTIIAKSSPFYLFKQLCNNRCSRNDLTSFFLRRIKRIIVFEKSKSKSNTPSVTICNGKVKHILESSELHSYTDLWNRVFGHLTVGPVEYSPRSGPSKLPLPP